MRKTCLDMVYELAKRDDRVLFGSDLAPDLLTQMKTEILTAFHGGNCRGKRLRHVSGFSDGGLYPVCEHHWDFYLSASF